MSYAVAIGIDKGDTTKLKISFQFSKPTSDKESSKTPSSYIYSIDCDSIYSGINLTNSYISKQVNLAHCKILIFSEEIAYDGISEEITTSLTNKKEEPETQKIEENSPKEKESYSEEHLLMVREFLLRLGYTILNRDPIFVAWKPIFVCKRWEKITVYSEFDKIADNIEKIHIFKDSDKALAFIEVAWKPTFIARIWYENIIFWWNDQIDADIFFRDHEEYSIEEITKFLESLHHY